MRILFSNPVSQRVEWDIKVPNSAPLVILWPSPHAGRWTERYVT